MTARARLKATFWVTLTLVNTCVLAERVFEDQGSWARLYSAVILGFTVYQSIYNLSASDAPRTGRGTDGDA